MRLSHQEIHSFGTFDTSLAAIAETVYNITFALAHFDHIDCYRPGVYAVVSAAPGEISHASAGNHRLGGCAAFINAGAPYMYSLNNGGSPSGSR
jgi:hypothetical protein